MKWDLMDVVSHVEKLVLNHVGNAHLSENFPNKTKISFLAEKERNEINRPTWAPVPRFGRFSGFHILLF